VKLLSVWGKNLTNSFSRQNKKLKKFERQHELDKYLVTSLNKKKIPSWKQIKYLPKILSRQEKIQFQVLSAIIVVCLIGLMINLYLLATIAVPRSGGQYLEGMIGSPQFINPILAKTNDVDVDIARLVFSGLLKYNKNRQLIPDLAESYEISADQLVYTFHLRRDVKWHNGEPFRADDVIFTVASIQDPQFKSPLSPSFRGIVAEKIDDYTVTFTLKEPFAPFAGLLTFGILPENLWYGIPPANADLTELNKKPIGTGPWKFDSFKKDQNGLIKSYALVRNENYYSEKSYLEKIIFKFYPDYNSAVEGLKSKEVDGLASLPKQFGPELAKYKNLVYHHLDQPQYTAIFFNQRKNELLKSDYIRQALALAVNKQKIIEDIYNNEGRIINEPNLPGIDSPDDIKKYPYNPSEAIALLEKNGWELTTTTTEDGVSQSVRKKGNWYLEITLTTVDQPKNIETAELIKNFWDEIGFKTTLKIVGETKILQETINPREYQALLFGENLGSDPDPLPFWHSAQNEYPGLNLAIFSNKTVDKLLEDARKINNWEERKKKYNEFQKIIAEELPTIFLFNSTYTYPVDKNIKGFDAWGIAVPADRFANLNEWYIKTRRVWK